jgi:flagellin-like protein
MVIRITLLDLIIDLMICIFKHKKMKAAAKVRGRKKGETGIGTLIVFIAMVLVAAIAASVLLGTSSSLQQRALTTGKQTEREVSGGILVIMVSGIKDNATFNDTNSTFSNYEMMIKLTAGSDPISLPDMIITVDTTNTSQSLEYVTSGGGNQTVYNVSYLKLGPGNKPHYLSRGDIIKLNFISTRPVGESEVVKCRIIPKHGQVVPVEFYTPDVLTTDRVVLYP